MKLCYVCSRYAGDYLERVMNLIEARALARLAEARGFAVVSWWSSLDPMKPLADSDPEVRAKALERSKSLAEMVGRNEGAIVLAEWYPLTKGMDWDFDAWQIGQCCLGGEIVKVSADEVAEFIQKQFREAFQRRAAGSPSWKDALKRVLAADRAGGDGDEMIEIPSDLHAKREANRKKTRDRKREANKVKALKAILLGDYLPDQPAIRIRPRWIDVPPQVTKADFDRYCKAK